MPEVQSDISFKLFTDFVRIMSPIYQIIGPHLAKVGQISNFCWDAISEGQNSHLRVEMRRVDDAC